MLRPNFFVNTPDILPASCSTAARRRSRSAPRSPRPGRPSWGVYAGFELFEHVAVRPGSEEYLDSEKFQIRVRDWDAAEASGRTLAPYLTRLNEIRRAHPALQQLRNLTVHSSDDDAHPGLHARPPATTRSSWSSTSTRTAPARPSCTSNMPALGMDWHDQFVVHDEITGETWTWGERNYVRLDPYVEPAHILTVRRPRQ